jgi:hypothetical protein
VSANLDPVLVEFDRELNCQSGLRIANASYNIAGLSACDPSTGCLVYGVSAPADFGSGISTLQPSAWIAEWTSSGITRVGENFPIAVAGQGVTPVQVERVGQGALLQTLFSISPGGRVDLFGRTYTTSAVGFTFVDTADLRTPTRHWTFTDSASPPMALIEASRFQVYGDKVVVLVSGVNVRFGSTLLSNDNRRHVHVVALKP